MNFKKGIFVLTAILLMSATTVSAFAYYGNQDVRGDAVCTDEQRMDRIRLAQGDSEFAQERAELREQLGDGTFAGEMMRARLNQSTNEFAQERIEARQQLTDGTCDGSMPQLQVRANGHFNQNVSE